MQEVDNNLNLFPSYRDSLRLRKENHCVLLINNSCGLFWEITPQQAMIITFFTGELMLKDLIEKISQTFNNKINDLIHIIQITIDLLEELNLICFSDRSSISKIIYNPFDFNYLASSTVDFYRNPISLVFVLTKKCNFKCIYCYMNAIDEKEIIENSIKMGIFEKITNEARILGVKSAFITGGEPFLDKNIISKIALLIENDIYPIIATNGSLLNERIIIQMKNLGLSSIQVSLDSVDLNESLRITKSSTINKVIRNIILLKNNGFRIRLKSVITNQNTENVKELIEFANSIEINDIEIIPAFRSNAGRKDFEKISINEASFIKLKQQIVCLSEEFNLKIKLFDPFQKWFDKPLKICEGGLSSLVIFPTGDVGICELIFNNEFIVGNVLFDKLFDIWHSDKIKRFRILPVNLIDTKCKNCKYLNFCRTGCFDNSKVVYDNYFAKDSNCLIG